MACRLRKEAQEDGAKTNYFNPTNHNCSSAWSAESFTSQKDKYKSPEIDAIFKIDLDYNHSNYARVSRENTQSTSMHLSVLYQARHFQLLSLPLLNLLPNGCPLPAPTLALKFGSVRFSLSPRPIPSFPATVLLTPRFLNTALRSAFPVV